MRHRAAITRKSSLESATDDIRERLAAAKRRLSGLIRVARDHARDPLRAGAALEQIASERLQRLLGQTSFGAFVRSEIGISRATAHRLRARAAVRSARLTPAERELANAATEARAWLRALGIRGARVSVSRSRGAKSVQIQLRPSEIARLPGERRRR